VHHSSNFKSSKKRYFYRIIAKHAFVRTALFAYSVMLCNRYPAIQVCKNVQAGKTKPNGQINHRFYGRVQDNRTDTV